MTGLVHCRVVFSQSADATSQYINYKYGPEAGAAAQQSVPVAKNMLDGEGAAGKGLWGVHALNLDYSWHGCTQLCARRLL